LGASALSASWQGIELHHPLEVGELGRIHLRTGAAASNRVEVQVEPADVDLHQLAGTLGLMAVHDGDHAHVRQHFADELEHHAGGGTETGVRITFAAVVRHHATDAGAGVQRFQFPVEALCCPAARLCGYQPPTSTTMRPRWRPSSTLGNTSGSWSKATRSPAMSFELVGFQSPAIRFQTLSLSLRGVAMELMPSRFTPLRMNGMTVVCSS